MQGISPQTKQYIGYGLLAVGLTAAAYYVWGLSTVTDRAKITKVDIADVGITWIKLNITITNFATVQIPFNGFYGQIMAQGYDLSDVSLVPDVKYLAAGATVVLPVKSSINWAQFAGLVPNIVDMISAGSWKQVITQLQPVLKGKIYSANLDVSVNIPLV